MKSQITFEERVERYMKWSQLELARELAHRDEADENNDKPKNLFQVFDLVEAPVKFESTPSVAIPRWIYEPTITTCGEVVFDGTKSDC